MGSETKEVLAITKGLLEIMGLTPADVGVLTLGIVVFEMITVSLFLWKTKLQCPKLTCDTIVDTKTEVLKIISKIEKTEVLILENEKKISHNSDKMEEKLVYIERQLHNVSSCPSQTMSRKGIRNDY